MAKKAPAKKAATKKAAATKKVAAKAAKKPAPKPPKKPPPKKPPAPRNGEGGGPVTFTVRVGQSSLTMEYEGGVPQDYEMVLFVKNEEQAQRAQDCIDRMGLRKLVIGIAKTYVDP